LSQKDLTSKLAVADAAEISGFLRGDSIPNSVLDKY